jgi:hypothetical protein
MVTDRNIFNMNNICMANKWRAIVEKVEEAWHDIMTSEAKQAEVPRVSWGGGGINGKI